MATRTAPPPEEVAEIFERIPTRGYSATRAWKMTDDRGRVADFVSMDAAVRYLAKELKTNAAKARQWLWQAADAETMMIFLCEIDGTLNHHSQVIPEDQRTGGYLRRWAANPHHIAVDADGHVVRRGTTYRQPNKETEWVITAAAYRQLVAAQKEAERKRVDSYAQHREEQEKADRERIGPGLEVIEAFVERLYAGSTLRPELRRPDIGMAGKTPYVEIKLVGDDVIAAFAALVAKESGA